MITDHGFRYETTLRINFDTPIGIISNGFETEEELLEYYNEFYNDISTIPFEEFKKYLNLEKEINNIFMEIFNNCKNEHIDLDWRDDYTVEIHGVDPVQFNESIINKLNLALEELLTKATVKEPIIY